MKRAPWSAVGILSAAGILLILAPAARAATNLALGRPATASSIEAAGFEAGKAVDGSTASRWASAEGLDPQWLYVDLGTSVAVSRVVLRWEAAYARSYQVQVSSNASTWSTVYQTTTGAGGVNDLAVSGTGRYVRIHGTVRGTVWGYSLFEIEVYGPDTATPTTPPRATATARPSATSTATARATATTRPSATATTRPTATSTQPPSGNLALGRPATASSVEAAGYEAGKAVDGSTGTRWSTAFGDPQWIYVDLGSSVSIGRVVLRWEAAYGRSYQIQVSNDASSWTSVYSTTTGAGGVNDLAVSGSGRYVRMYGTARGTAWGYSLFEMEVYAGTGGPTPTATSRPRATATATARPRATATSTATPTVGGTWRKANLTNFESYPDPNSDECVNYNGCLWAGQFAFVDGKQTEQWVMDHNIAAVHERDAQTYKLKNLRLKQGTRLIDVTVYDMCADSDCSGCCTNNANAGGIGFLIDIEKYTMQRFGSGSGVVDWICLNCP